MPLGTFHKVGDRVILKKHHPIDPNCQSSDNWAKHMDNYIGKVAQITASAGVDSWGCPIWYIDLTGNYVWRDCSMILADNQKAITTTIDVQSKDSGCKCVRCQEFFPYANPAPNFKCWSCRH